MTRPRAVAQADLDAVTEDAQRLDNRTSKLTGLLAVSLANGKARGIDLWTEELRDLAAEQTAVAAHKASLLDELASIPAVPADPTVTPGPDDDPTVITTNYMPDVTPSWPSFIVYHRSAR